MRYGGDRLRVGPWRGDDRIAYIAPTPESHAPAAGTIRRCCELLAARGYAEALTAALGPTDSIAFLDAGFTVRERLHLLVHELGLIPDPPPVALRRGRRADRAAALEVDGRSFDSFWRLDGPGLDEAMRATPSSRFRVADVDGEVGGYAVSGRAGDRGFLQRLAVDPAHRRSGIGRGLVADGLRWMKRRGATRAVVNTQEHNEAALSLYRRVGFHLQPGGLAVLHTTLG